jgi:hypothetical protein
MNRSNAELMQLSDLIGLIYEGATDPSRWTKDILPAVAKYIQAPGCFFIHRVSHIVEWRLLFSARH